MTKIKRIYNYKRAGYWLCAQYPQHTELRWSEKLVIEIDTILAHPWPVSVQIFLFLANVITLAVWECTLFLDYLQNYEHYFREKGFSPNKNIIAVHTVYFLVVGGHLVLFEKCMAKIIRHLPIVTLDMEARRSRQERRRLDKNLKNSLRLNLDLIIRRYAWQKLLNHSSEHTRDFLVNVMLEKRFTCEVDWTALTFEHKVTKISPKVKDGPEIKTHLGDIQTGTKWVTLFSCYYDNQADCKQSHAFSGSRDTTTWVDVDLEQYYTVKKQVCVKLNQSGTEHNLPVDEKNTLSLTKAKGEVFQKVHTWDVNSQVEVEPSSRAHAQLLARQECSVVEFEIRTTLSNPKGVLPVTFKYRKRAISFVVNITNFHKAFQLVEEGGVLFQKEKRCTDVIEEKWLDKDGVEHLTFHPQIITRGSCVCHKWTDQKVDIKTSPLSMDESTSDGDHNMNKTPVNYTEEDPIVDSFVLVD